MKAQILHDQSGNIIAISKIAVSRHAGSKSSSIGMLPGKGQKIIEAELSREDAARPLNEIHTAYRVDVATSKLVRIRR